MDRKKELRKGLSNKQKIFCSEYVLDWNGSRAARAAGYSEKAARSTAARLITKDNIKEYIGLIKDDIEGELGLTKLKNIKILQNMAHSNIADIYRDWMTMEDFETLKSEQPEILECIQEISTKTEMEKGSFIDSEPVEVRYIKIKLYDKRLALQDLNKMLGWNGVEKHEVKNIEDTSTMTTEELIKRANAINKIKGK